MFSVSVGLWVAMLLGITQGIILLVTIYFHRAMAHRALDLHPRLLRACRFMAWFWIGMNPQEFAAVHRKHHAWCDTENDPHSPVRFGWHGVLLKGLALYRREVANPETVRKYGQGLPQDPWEGFYRRHPNLGLLLQGILWTALLGGPGLLAWGIILAWIPFWAAGVVNGLGHAFGYRRFDTDDRSTNLSPWGLWIGGEELHNNHHADPSSARFSRAWYELDLGWGVIRLLEILGWAQVRHRASQAQPQVVGLLQQRYAYLRGFRQAVSQDVRARLKTQGYRHWNRVMRHVQATSARLSSRAQHALRDPVLARLHQLDQQMRALWNERMAHGELEKAFERWLTELQNLDLPRVRAWSHQWQPQAA